MRYIAVTEHENYTECICLMYLCCLCIDFSVSQSIDKSIRRVWNILYVTWDSLHPSGTHYNPFVRGHCFICLACCLQNILHHGTLEILHLCHLGICSMYTMETRSGLIEYPCSPHIEEGRSIPFTFCVQKSYFQGTLARICCTQENIQKKNIYIRFKT